MRLVQQHFDEGLELAGLHRDLDSTQLRPSQSDHGQFLRHAASHGSLSIGFMSALMEKVAFEGLGDLSARRGGFRFAWDMQLCIAIEHDVGNCSTPLN